MVRSYGKAATKCGCFGAVLFAFVSRRAVESSAGRAGGMVAVSGALSARERPYTITNPPFTGSSCPVTKRDSELSR